MRASKRPSRDDFVHVAGLTSKVSWRLQEIGLYTVGEVLDSTDTYLCKARAIGTIRAAELRRRMEDHLTKPVEAEVAVQIPPPADPRLLARPILGILVAFAHGQDERIRLVLMRGLTDGPEHRMTWNAIAGKLGISLPTLARSRIRARDCLRKDPVGMLLSRRIDGLRREEGPCLREAMKNEPWAKGMPDHALAMLARTLVGVDIDRGALPVIP
jgi:hypothetical protein